MRRHAHAKAHAARPSPLLGPESCSPELEACILGRLRKAKTKDFSQGVYDGLKSCPPHPKVDRRVQTDAWTIPDDEKEISDLTLRAGLASRGLVAVSLRDLRRQIVANIAHHLRLDPTHSMEILFTMERIPRAVIQDMWGHLTPSQSDSDVVEYTWDSIERAMNFTSLALYTKWGMKNARLHKHSVVFYAAGTG